MNIEELDRGWADVLRRAERRPHLPRRLVVAVAAVAAVATAAPALGVLLTRPNAPTLPLDQIRGKVTTVTDPKTKQTLLEYGRWKGHDGVCYLVPHVRAGCLLAGERSAPFSSLPLLITVRRQRPTGQWQPLVRRHRIGFQVAALAGGKATLVKR